MHKNMMLSGEWHTSSFGILFFFFRETKEV